MLPNDEARPLANSSNQARRGHSACALVIEALVPPICGVRWRRHVAKLAIGAGSAKGDAHLSGGATSNELKRRVASIVATLGWRPVASARRLLLGASNWIARGARRLFAYGAENVHLQFHRLDIAGDPMSDDRDLSGRRADSGRVDEEASSPCSREPKDDHPGRPQGPPVEAAR